MSKQAIALLQAERDHVASAGLDFGGRLSDEDSSTVAEYDDAIAAVQKLMADQEALLWVVGRVHFDCDGLHHAKKDRHLIDEPCPVVARVNALIEKASKP